MTRISDTSLLPLNYMMHAFGSKDLTDKQKGITFVATITATYLSYNYLPPNMNKWVGGITILSGAAYFIFGSLSKFTEYVYGLFSNPSKFGSANMWSGDDPPPNQLHLGFNSSGTRASKKTPEGTQPSPSTPHSSNPGMQHPGVPVQTKDGGQGALHPGAKTSGGRAQMKEKNKP